MGSDGKKLNNWFCRNGWHRDNRGYEQYIWKEQGSCFVTHFGGKKYQRITEVTIYIWPANKTISISNKFVWRSDDGDEKEADDKFGYGFGTNLTVQEFAKIKELYDALDNELQAARQRMSDK